MNNRSFGLKIKDLGGGSPRVLVVDDDHLLNTIIRNALADKKVNVDQAEDGVQATLLLENNKYDLVLCDIVMPGVDGLKILHFVRERDPELPFIMVTSQSDMKSVLKAIRLGISDYITKPFDVQELGWRVEKALDRSRLLRMERNYKKNLEQMLVQQAEENRRLFFEAVESLVNTLEAKDVYTKGHSIRVTRYAMGFVKHIGLPFEEATNVQVAARLHDIGKISIDDAILNKQGKLTVEEYEEIKKHPETSCSILKPIIDDETLEIIMHHHERWDGNGYPGGLAGEKIPFGARVLCLADAFDAISSERSYKAALPFEESIAEIKSGSGAYFSPDLVYGFVESLRKNRKLYGFG
ncbi:MAG TPA: response regulator [Proteobacteria bacterium]|nr:cyclic di-GMP phosphodiesterase response regulator RpfG [bacterium BMS3Abin14]HDL53208.1 response regulator [Pseudomonadota bacterium]